MSSFLSICFVIALLLTLRELHDFGMYGNRCVACGGKGKHKRDCSMKSQDEGDE